MDKEMDKKAMAEMAHAKLLAEGKEDAASRLRRAIDSTGRIVLGLGDLDWEIETELESVGFEQRLVNHNGARATFILQ